MTTRKRLRPPRNREYDAFSWLYSHHWGADFHAEALPALRRLFLDRLAPRASVLDLCCGDGRLIHQLIQAGYRAAGLDSSEKMLAYARRRNPGAKLILGDARDFHSRTRFDAVISTFDSLNHVLRQEELKSVFRNVYTCLKPGGYFAFDLNREEAYLNLWTIPWFKVTDTMVAVAQGSYDPETGVAICEVAQLRRGSAWKRSDFVLTQRFHPAREVVEGLKIAGFTAIRETDAHTLGMTGGVRSGRSFYLARKTGFA